MNHDELMGEIPPKIAKHCVDIASLKSCLLRGASDRLPYTEILENAVDLLSEIYLQNHKATMESSLGVGPVLICDTSKGINSETIEQIKNCLEDQGVHIAVDPKDFADELVKPTRGWPSSAFFVDEIAFPPSLEDFTMEMLDPEISEPPRFIQENRITAKKKYKNKLPWQR